jgi:hypothetical protein
MCLFEFKSFQGHCSDESQMKRFGNCGTSFCTPRAATLIEAKENGVETGLFLVHDWQNFVHAFPELATARWRSE